MIASQLQIDNLSFLISLNKIGIYVFVNAHRETVAMRITGIEFSGSLKMKSLARDPKAS